MVGHEYMIDRYEYIVESGFDSKKLEDILNRAGQDGFRLVWMKQPTDTGDTAHIAVFERQKSFRQQG